MRALLAETSRFSEYAAQRSRVIRVRPVLANPTIQAILAVGPPAGDKGNHTAFLIITPLLFGFLLGVIIWAIWRRRHMR